MKKINLIAAVAVLAFTISCISCSTPNSNQNPDSPSSGGSSGGSGSGDSQGDGGSGPTSDNGNNPFVWPDLPSGAYTVLPVNTPGSAGSSNNTTITYVTFGLWPQTKKTDNITVSSATRTLNGWTTYAGSDNNYYVKESNNYYKVEPIKWRILTNEYDHDGNSETAGKKLLLADNILTGCIYYDSEDFSGTRTIGSTQIYANNYEHNRIRAFLNGLTYQKKATADAAQIANTEFNGNGFLQKAFT